MTKRFDTLWCLTKDTVGVSVGHLSYRVAIRTTVERILGLRDSLTKIEGDHLAALFSRILEAPYILSLEGLGIVSAAIIIGETGGLTRYKHAEEHLKLAGLNLSEISSGTHNGKVRISKGGTSSFAAGVVPFGYRNGEKRDGFPRGI